jgi:hypothetical protein
VSRGPALWATVIALALINIGAASSIVALMGTPTFGPVWVGLIVVALGVISGLFAIRFWRQYLAGIRA